MSLLNPIPHDTDPAQFMYNVFRGWKATERPVVCAQVAGGACPAYPWPDTALLAVHTHYSVGLVTYPQVGSFYRRNALWTGAALLVLDDIHEKAQAPSVAPTFKVQTKPGSEQWGYVFREPMRNAADFDTLVESCIAAGLGDPGARGRIRLARLPGSKPPGKEHTARLIWADWDRRARPDVDAFVKALGIQKVSRGGRIFEGKPLLGDPGDDPVLEWLAASGRIIGPAQGGGWWPILCPWADEHTGGDVTGTRYHQPTLEDGVRSFACHHGQCAHRRFHDFEQAFRKAGAPPVWRNEGEYQEVRERMGRDDEAGMTGAQKLKLRRLLG